MGNLMIDDRMIKMDYMWDVNVSTELSWLSISPSEQPL
jgi:hypothetical protein